MKKDCSCRRSGNSRARNFKFLEENGYRAADVIALEPGAPLGSMVSYGEETDLDVKICMILTFRRLISLSLHRLKKSLNSLLRKLWLKLQSN